jgi:hypothetical protein
MQAHLMLCGRNALPEMGSILTSMGETHRQTWLIHGAHFAYQIFALGRHVRGAHELPFLDLVHDSHVVTGARERGPAANQLEYERTERPDICTLSMALTQNNLWCHVLRRPAHRVRLP